MRRALEAWSPANGRQRAIRDAYLKQEPPGNPVMLR